ncbi:hypothetical protein CONPUDRAFT_146995 [Coniophora puteana RWD-64-598 SS2]|uniref:C2H2-type domain-containing protein n=1 Tax=Coniophora puteana (strain RWD-64-598) TaxID=741705 RepID=A0A5M3MAV2_CONPW|nr:uncharacterized protein CONPUDRAFT_146995 [Coniophora puteana RWD-64-598 SS2]EIW75920.1 hypothetical protein CONPUDRAFT_146995 [Coniophora puteana RWD-64-598 SS2]
MDQASERYKIWCASTEAGDSTISLPLHAAIMAPERKRRPTCECTFGNCQMDFTSTRDARVHIEGVHLHHRRYSCFCGMYATADPSAIRRHRKTKHSDVAIGSCWLDNDCLVSWGQYCCTFNNSEASEVTRVDQGQDEWMDDTDGSFQSPNDYQNWGIFYTATYLQASSPNDLPPLSSPPAAPVVPVTGDCGAAQNQPGESLQHSANDFLKTFRF